MAEDRVGAFDPHQLYEERSDEEEPLDVRLHGKELYSALIEVVREGERSMGRFEGTDSTGAEEKPYANDQEFYNEQQSNYGGSSCYEDDRCFVGKYLDDRSLVGKYLDDRRCLFLELLTDEIRAKIYRFLLINPVLGTSRAIVRYAPNHDYVARYGLSPAILRTCFKIYQDATEVLYGENTFVFEIIKDNYSCCPITRIFTETGYYQKPVPIYTVPVFPKIKNWNVILGTAKPSFKDSPYAPLVRFCRVICDLEVESLTVQIVPRGELFNPSSWDPSDPRTPGTDYHDLYTVLRPLWLLRNIKKFNLCELEGDERPFYLNRPTLPEVDRSALSETRKVGMKHIIEGNTSIEYTFKQFRDLLLYAGAFEPHDKYRRDMRPPLGQAREWIRNRHNVTMKDNPFKPDNYPFHPVEEALMHARIASEKNRGSDFRAARADVLAYLEPQYRRITSAATQIAEFVKSHKRPGGRGDTAVLRLEVGEHGGARVAEVAAAIFLAGDSGVHEPLLDGVEGVIVWLERVVLHCDIEAVPNPLTGLAQGGSHVFSVLGVRLESPRVEQEVAELFKGVLDRGVAFDDMLHANLTGLAQGAPVDLR